ncbi:hypothetical protein CHARACLAT_015100 [Characodon lateralis]|uniref:Uncharacterized protein n=1 Tax=Characodon lateralis TaxID=208331 RepID=A0ABU7EBN0_9TELE|nr:hypothetical protein [Characodon lateralis]
MVTPVCSGERRMRRLNDPTLLYRNVGLFIVFVQRDETLKHLVVETLLARVVLAKSFTEMHHDQSSSTSDTNGPQIRLDSHRDGRRRLNASENLNSTLKSEQKVCADISQHDGVPPGSGCGSGHCVLVSPVQLYLLSEVEGAESGGDGHLQLVAV